MKTKAGEQVNSVFGVASMLLQILKTEQPDGLLFCFDEGDETFRHEEYAEYKAGRTETPDDFYIQIPRIFELIDTFQIPRVSLPKVEADDLLCAYSKAAEKEGHRVTIITGDRDAFQLASDKIRIAIPAKGYQQPEYLDPAGIEKKYGVRPDQIASYKGLTGDASDNLKGVHGIGPKAAAALLSQYQTLESVYEHLEEIKASWKEKLVTGRESAFFCERMARLVCDFPLPVPYEKILLTSIDLAPVMELFQTLQFILLTRRLQDFAKTPYALSHFTLPAGSELPKISVGVTSKPDTETQMSLL